MIWIKFEIYQITIELFRIIEVLGKASLNIAIEYWSLYSFGCLLVTKGQLSLFFHILINIKMLSTKFIDVSWISTLLPVMFYWMHNCGIFFHLKKWTLMSFSGLVFEESVWMSATSANIDIFEISLVRIAFLPKTNCNV